LNPWFKTQPLTAGEIALVLVLSTIVFIAVEMRNTSSGGIEIFHSQQ